MPKNKEELTSEANSALRYLAYAKAQKMNLVQIPNFKNKIKGEIEAQQMGAYQKVVDEK